MNQPRADARAPEIRRTALCAGAALLLAGTCVVAAAVFPLAEPDEPRYAEIAREMLVRADWITPHLNFLPYVEKPPLVMWGSALSFRLLGVNELAARLPSLVSAFGLVLLIFMLARDMYGRRTAWLAAAVFATAPFTALMSHTLTLDITLTFFVTLGLAAVWFARQHGSRAWYRVAYVAVALGTLTKGPIAGLLIGAIAVTALYADGGLAAVRLALDRTGIVIAALIILPWFVAVSWRLPDFPRFFVMHEHVDRFFASREHREPFWFFIVSAPLLLFPWSALPILAPSLWRSDVAPRRWSRASRYLLVWSGFVFGFFSLSSAKLLPYVLPGLPPASILLARLCVRAIDRGEAVFLGRASILFVATGMIMGVVATVLSLFVGHWRVPILRPYLYLGAFVLIAAGATIHASVRRGDGRRALAQFTAAAIALVIVVISGRGMAISYRDLGRVAAEVVQPGDRLAIYMHFVPGIFFYSAQRVTLVRRWGDLRFGFQHGDVQGYFWETDDHLRAAWNSPTRVFLVINKDELPSFQPPLFPAPIVIASEGKKILIANHGLSCGN